MVVPRGSTPLARSLLKASGAFDVEARTLFTTHIATGVPIEIIAPPRMFKGEFDENTPYVRVEGVRVLHPLRILDAKCQSIIGRAREEKKVSDGVDITHLLGYCLRKSKEGEEGYEVNEATVPNASAELVEYMDANGWVPRDAWEAVGYRVGGGEEGAVATH